MFISRVYVNKLKGYKLKLNVNGTNIKAYDSITLLGVDIDNALNFSGHISNICKKSSQRVGVINRLKTHLHPRLIAVVCFCFESLYCSNA